MNEAPLLLRRCISLLICCALIFSPLLQAAQLSLPSGDLKAPEITQPEYIDKIKNGDSLRISVNVTDNVEVKQVVLYYRTIGTKQYKLRQMSAKPGSDNYEVIINADDIPEPGIEYYIQAMDTAGNTLLHGYSFSPLSVKTVSDSTLATNSGKTTGSKESSIFSNKWLWIGLGVLVLGAAAGGGGGGGDSPPAATSSNGLSLTVLTAEPVN